MLPGGADSSGVVLAKGTLDEEERLCCDLQPVMASAFSGVREYR